jgi:corrinoid protein of di/trimethylamine methyltransferase
LCWPQEIDALVRLRQTEMSKERERTSQERYLEALRNSVVNLDFESVTRASKDAMNAGMDPLKAIEEGLAAGVRLVGEKFERYECFLAELIVSGEVMKEGISIIKPYIKGESAKPKGKVILATVMGDNHDIGKNLVATMLIVSGFDVVDLGVDVPTETIVEAVRSMKPQVLGLSALLTVTMSVMEDIIKVLKANGLREHLKVIVGGSPVTEEFAKTIGADYRAADAMDGVRKCTEWVGLKRR